ncbi:MAG TPA: ATP-binding protein [Mycobacterium sp.]|nr:ATP-binding protein [Mycobacterium sp.]HNM11444.1 ATP-binding protein [Mycobacterium sp.]
MTTPSYPCPSSDGNRFAFNEFTADPYAAGHVRNEFAAWLGRRVDLNAIRFSDVVLAVNEALANAAEFAYLKNSGVGTIDVEAVQNSEAATLTVTITDQGCWREPDPATRGRTRGRGIPLMRALADDLTIDTSKLGTTVCLRFDNVKARAKAGAAVR